MLSFHPATPALRFAFLAALSLVCYHLAFLICHHAQFSYQMCEFHQLFVFTQNIYAQTLCFALFIKERVLGLAESASEKAASAWAVSSSYRRCIIALSFLSTDISSF